MMKNTNIFKTVADRIVRNLINHSEQVLEFKGFYPQKAIIYMTTKMKAFKVESITKEYNNGQFVYTVKYKDLNKYSDLTGSKIEAYEYKKERAIRKGFTEHYTGAVSTKFNTINDDYRAELDCPNFSSERDETGYAACPFNDRGFEKLDPVDNCALEIRLQMLGYNNYQDFLDKNKCLTPNEAMEMLDIETQEFYNNFVAPDYSQSEELSLV
jgi:hypothetical protein